MGHEIEAVFNIAAAWFAGAVIGLDRSFSGRAAGFRTHSLVALAAAAAAVVSLEPMFVQGMGGGDLRLDASRLSQGVMTGIGFLGAGVIFKEGISVQGLTTAASIWACAATGFLFGLGMYLPACLVTAGVMVTLIAFRAVEERAPWPVHAFVVIRFPTEAAPSEAELRSLLGDRRVRMRDMSYRLIDGGRIFEFSADVEVIRGEALRQLAERLRGIPGLLEFELERASK